MASRVTDQPLLQKISERHLQCQICMDRFKEPKMLECSHSFCLECLEHLAETNPTSQMLTCPACRDETSLSGRRVSELRTDFKLISLLDEITEHETELESQQEIQPPSQGSVSKCSKHTDNDVIMYCGTCKQLICTTCIAKDHRMHHVVELNEILDNCKRKAVKLFAEVDQLRIEFKTALQDIAMSSKKLDSLFAATKAKISKKADEEIAKEIARIREEEQKLMGELDQIHKAKAKTMKIAEARNNKDMTTAKNKKDEVIRLMDTGNCCEILHLIENRLQELKDYTDFLQPTKVPHELAYMDFEDDQKSLGRLVPKEELKPKAATSATSRQPICNPQTKLTQKKWMLKTELTNYRNRAKQTRQLSPCDIAVLSNSDIVVADLKSCSLIKISADSTKALPKTTSVKDLFYPSRVTVNKNDELIGVDHEAIKIFNRNYQLIHEFKGGEGSDRWPSCIAVDNNNRIAVGYPNMISLHRPDGSLLSKLPALGIGQYLTIHKHQFIYTNLDGKKLVSVDFEGAVVFSVDIYQSGWPRGVCCDKDGSIYVAVGCARLPPSQGEIQQYSPIGNYMRRIIMLHESPHGILPTASGDLVVTTEKSVLIYHHLMTI